DELDVSRGDMIVRRKNGPQTGTRIDAMLCWMDEEAMDPSRHYLLQHTTQTVQAHVERLDYRIDVDTLHREPVDTAGVNDIGRGAIETAKPLFFGPYAANSETGAFILPDPYSNKTVAGGMIRGAALDEALDDEELAARGREDGHSPNVVWE